MFAVIKTGGKQYRVREGDSLKVEKLIGNVGDELKLETLMLADEDGKDVQIGAPKLDKEVAAKILEHGRGEKVHVIKFKSKVRYKKNVGHRQPYTKIQITKL
ncbi:MAG: 50S ribosomal protein L21 [Patescibacteria group bacterium]